MAIRGKSTHSDIASGYQHVFKGYFSLRQTLACLRAKLRYSIPVLLFCEISHWDNF